MEELAFEIRGRQLAMETLLLSMLLHTAANTDDPALFAQEFMKDGEASLQETAEEAIEPDLRIVAQYAMATFIQMSEALTALVGQIKPLEKH